jgi:hypothetical protein
MEYALNYKYNFQTHRGDMFLNHHFNIVEFRLGDSCDSRSHLDDVNSAAACFGGER